jgi:hypothetical protein
MAPMACQIRFDTDLVPVPEPFADLVRRHLHARPNMMTASNQDSTWLFLVIGPDSRCTTTT